MEVTPSRESLHVDSAGSVSTIRVRLRHALVLHCMLAIPNAHPAFMNMALHALSIDAFDSILALTFFCYNPIWIQLPQLGVFLNATEAEDLVALFRYLAYLSEVPTDYFASATKAKKTMEDIKNDKITPSESSKKITRDFIAALADKAPYNISRGFVQAGIRSMNPASVCDALGAEAAGLASHIAFASFRWCVKIATVAQRSGLPLLHSDVFIKVREVKGSMSVITVTRTLMAI
jgi:hypothetical protein